MASNYFNHEDDGGPENGNRPEIAHDLNPPDLTVGGTGPIAPEEEIVIDDVVKDLDEELLLASPTPVGEEVPSEGLDHALLTTEDRDPSVTTTTASNNDAATATVAATDTFASDYQVAGDIPVSREGHKHDGHKSQVDKKTDLLKGLSIPIDFSPKHDPEKVKFNLDQLVVPIEYESAPLKDLSSIIKKLDIPCDPDSLKADVERERETRTRRRAQKSLSLGSENITHESSESDARLNFREISSKLDLPGATGTRARSRGVGSDGLGFGHGPGMQPLDFPSLPLGVNRDLIKAPLSSMDELDYKKYLESADAMNTLEGMSLGKSSMGAERSDLKLSDLRTLAVMRTVNELVSSDDHRVGKDGAAGYAQPGFNPDLNYSAGKVRRPGPQFGSELHPDQMHLPPPLQFNPQLNFNPDLNYALGERMGSGDKGRKKKKGVRNEPPVPLHQLLPPPDLPPVTVENWAQCESCKKWRRLPMSVDTEKLPDTWVCSLNIWDPIYNSCEVPEEVFPEKYPDQRLVDLVPGDPALVHGTIALPHLGTPTNAGLKVNELKAGQRPGHAVAGRRKDRYYEGKRRKGRGGRASVDYEGKNADDVYDMRTPTSSNRFYVDSRSSSRKRMHISPMVSNVSSYDDECEVIRFKMANGDASHPLKKRLTIYSDTLTTLLATELPHSSLFLDNFRRIPRPKDEDKDEDGHGGTSAPSRSRSSTKDGSHSREDGNINIGFACRTRWGLKKLKKRPRDQYKDDLQYITALNHHLNQDQNSYNYLFNTRHFTRSSKIKNVIRRDRRRLGSIFSPTGSRSPNSAVRRMFKRLSSQIPDLTDIIKLKESELTDFYDRLSEKYLNNVQNNSPVFQKANVSNIINKAQVLKILYRFAKNKVQRNGELRMDRSDKVVAFDDNIKVNHVSLDVPPASSAPSPAQSNASSPTAGEIKKAIKDANIPVLKESDKVLFCTRYKFVENNLKNIIKFKEEMDRIEKLKRDAKAQEEKLLEAAAAAAVVEEIPSEVPSSDGTKATTPDKVEAALGKEPVEPEEEEEAPSHLDYPLPNIRQLSKRYKNLHYTSLPFKGDKKMLKNYSMLLQPIPDDLKLTPDKLKENIIKMLSIPIEYKGGKKESAKADATGQVEGAPDGAKADNFFSTDNINLLTLPIPDFDPASVDGNSATIGPERATNGTECVT